MHVPVDRFAQILHYYLPSDVMHDARVIDLVTAVRQIHFPDSKEDAARATKRLAFDEFLLIQLGILQRKQAMQQTQQGMAMLADQGLLDACLGSILLELARAQQRVIDMMRG